MQGNLTTLLVSGVTGVTAFYLAALTLVQYASPNTLRARIRFLTAGSLIVVTVAILVSGVVQYLVWRADPLTDLLLPPHRPASYFAAYLFMRLAAPYLISGVVGLLGWFALARLNALRGGALAEDHEPALLFIGTFLSGYPGWIAYLPLLGGVYALILAAVTIRHGGGSRHSLERLWLPAALLGILLANLVLARLAGWSALKL